MPSPLFFSLRDATAGSSFRRLVFIAYTALTAAARGDGRGNRLLVQRIPPTATTSAIRVLPLGYDLTQPLLVGIVTTLADEDALGQTMGLKMFPLFAGFGIGSWLFGAVLRWGFEPAMRVFGGVQ